MVYHRPLSYAVLYYLYYHCSVPGLAPWTWTPAQRMEIFLAALSQILAS